MFFQKVTIWVNVQSIKIVVLKKEKVSDEDGIRTHACIAQWISSPSP